MTFACNLDPGAKTRGRSAMKTIKKYETQRIAVKVMPGNFFQSSSIKEEPLCGILSIPPTDRLIARSASFGLQNLYRFSAPLQKLPKMSVLLPCLLGIQPVLQGVLVPHRRTGRTAAVHSATTVRHCRSFTGRTLAGHCSAARGLGEISHRISVF